MTKWEHADPAKVQVYKEGVGFDSESAMIWWHEEESPFIKIARVTIPPQRFTSEEKLESCDNTANQPWHTTAEHRPLDNINRVRKFVYEAIADYRHEHNNAADKMSQPADLSAYRALP